MARTKTEAALAEAERAHADDPERADLLARTRRFKASWLELAEALASVRRGGQWKRWGYSSFEEYARRELHLRQETVDKLTGSFQFLQRRAPEVLERDGLSAPLPSYQSVDFLRRAEEADGVDDGTLAELRRRVIDDAAPLPSISRKYREVVFPIPDDEKQQRERAALSAAVARLRQLLEESNAVPRRLASEVGDALDRLKEALDARGDAVS